ncbi:MAG TPA: hypothetical protein VD866_01010, partial [Urbifossiella sp.]|nr:hypothetical protein [Urbifossiella sp.]
ITGRSGVSAKRAVAHKIVAQDGLYSFLPGGGVIDGAKSRDWSNADSTLNLQPGLLMGEVTASGKYAPTILGVTQGAYTSGGTSITVTAAQAVEIARRVGTSGNLYYIGPPAAAGTVATLGPIAFSAINTGTGVITTATLGANLIAGGLVVAGDGSETPITFIPDGWGIPVGSDSADVSFPQIPTAGLLRTDGIIGYPTDTSLRAWLRASLNRAGGGLFQFTDRF